MLARVIQSVQKPATLFLLGEVQEDLDHLRPVAIEMTFESVDVVMATTPKCVVRRLSGAIGVGSEPFRMHAYDEHVLVVGPIEDADVAARRQADRGAPEEVMG